MILIAPAVDPIPIGMIRTIGSRRGPCRGFKARSNNTSLTKVVQFGARVLTAGASAGNANFTALAASRPEPLWHDPCSMLMAVLSALPWRQQ